MSKIKPFLLIAHLTKHSKKHIYHLSDKVKRNLCRWYISPFQKEKMR